VRKVAPGATVFELSARTGEGVGAWLDFLREQRRLKSMLGAAVAIEPG